MIWRVDQKTKVHDRNKYLRIVNGSLNDAFSAFTLHVVRGCKLLIHTVEHLRKSRYIEFRACVMLPCTQIPVDSLGEILTVR